MKQDYLWDKKGTDPEIEGLEDLLSGFAYAETPPPVVKSEASIPFFRRLLDLRLLVPVAVGAMAVLAIVGIQFWPTNRQVQPGVEFAGTEPAKVNPVPPKQPDQYFTVKTPDTSLADRQKPQFIKANFKPTVRRPAKRTTPKLTKEEKFAYDQLMLALSFTSSKLKIVQDAANGIDDSNTPNLRIK